MRTLDSGRFRTNSLQHSYLPDSHPPSSSTPASSSTSIYSPAGRSWSLDAQTLNDLAHPVHRPGTYPRKTAINLNGTSAENRRLVVRWTIYIWLGSHSPRRCVWFCSEPSRAPSVGMPFDVPLRLSLSCPHTVDPSWPRHHPCDRVRQPSARSLKSQHVLESFHSRRWHSRVTLPPYWKNRAQALSALDARCQQGGRSPLYWKSCPRCSRSCLRDINTMD